MNKCGWILTFAVLVAGGQALYPRESETRQVKSLDGVWDFVLASPDDPDRGFRDSWFAKSLSRLENETVLRMPVPSSYNDVTQDPRIRDHVGWVWYEDRFFVPAAWANDTRIFLRFDSVHYHAQVFLNDLPVVNHTGGHLPFQVDVTPSLKFRGENKLTVAVDNTLSATTVPQGELLTKPQNPGFQGSYRHLKTFFDFFNYAGIHRSVRLYAVPDIHIHDISVITGIDDAGSGIVEYSFVYDDKRNALGKSPLSKRSDECTFEIYDKVGTKVSSAIGCTGAITIQNPNLWWPIGMSLNPGYLYTAKFVLSSGDAVIDVYYEKIGLRVVEVVNRTLLINKQPFYFKGFGKHEDSAIRGRGLDIPLIIKDMNLIKWIGANSFRTSHYPYSEEQMDIADETGIVVINECPAVGLQFFSDALFDQHVKSVQELIHRDKNRPSVIMWSIANEPVSSDKRSDDYFKKLATLAKELDRTRPLTAAISASSEQDLLAKHLDVLMINRYFGWYQDTGSIDVVKDQTVYCINEWHKKHPDKPIMISEYGADTIPGIHSSPSYVFTEDYQAEILLNYFEGFDILRNEGNLIGEMIWNFVSHNSCHSPFAESFSTSPTG